MSKIRYIIICFLVTYVYAGNSMSMSQCNWLSAQNIYKINSNVKQIIIVKSTTGSYGKLTVCDKFGDGWYPNQIENIDVVLGKNGVIAAEEKREGDGKTPLGLYSFGMAFGHSKYRWMKLPYRVLDENDKFIDDPKSAEYNTWVHGKTNAKSYEDLLSIGELYKLGIVINYNMNPIIPDMGSAIFMHVWKEHDYTAGCVALRYTELVKVMKLLDEKNNPHILIIPKDLNIRPIHRMN